MHSRFSQIDGQLITKIVSAIVSRHSDMNDHLLHIQATNIFDDKFAPFGKGQSTTLRFSSFDTESYRKRMMKFFEEEQDTAFDFIFADYPFGLREFNEIDNCLFTLDYLNPGGIGIYLMPGQLASLKHRKNKIVNDIASKGYKVLSVLDLPKNFFRPQSGIQSSLLLVTRDYGEDKTFFAKYTDDDEDLWGMQSEITANGIWALQLRNHLRNKDVQTVREFNKELEGIIDEYIPEDFELLEENSFDGFEENIMDFEGFTHWEQTKEIQKLDSEYGGYSLIELKELADIKSTKDSFLENEDAIYIPAIGRTEVTDILPTKDSKKKPQNYYQIIIKDKRIMKDYLLNFLNSEFGQRMIKLELSKYQFATIQRLRVADVKSMGISVPNLGIQEEIIEHVAKLKRLKELLSEIENSISIRPISSTDQLDKLNQIYESSMDLSESEKAFNEIKKGESTSREFKQTYILDLKTKSRNKDLAFGCVKTVAGFLNGSGGTLYIGVADWGEITGIEVEVGKKGIIKNLDIYINDIKNNFIKRIGRASMNNVDFIPIKIRGKQILLVECLQSEHQVYVDKFDTYLRVGPSTEKLEGHDLVTFSKERFK